MAFAILTPTESDAAAPEALRATIDSLEAQLASLYAEREAEASHARAAADHPDFELVALYEDKLRAGSRLNAELRETVAGLEAQLTSLYAEREEGAGAHEAVERTVAGLAEQLTEFYALQERAGGRPLADVVDMAVSFEAQLDALYAERAMPSPAEEAVESLEAQVAALLEEKQALEATLLRAQARTRALVSALVDHSFATD